MNRKMKTLGLALVAVLATTAVMASAAQAQFTSDAESTAISGNQVEAVKYTAGAGVGAISCSTFTVAGTQSGKSASELTLAPTIGGCTDSLGRTAHVVSNTLVWHLLSGFNKGKATVTGELKTTVTGSPHCTIVITGDQTWNGFSYTNHADGSVTITLTANNITSSISGGFFACGTSANHSGTGTLTGTIRYTGNGGSARVSVD